ncbi:MAG: cell division protein FtsQ [Granulosicoccus sp.]|jgi:cell division protein FtsQ
MSTTVEQLLGSGPVLPLAPRRVSSSTRWSIGAIGLIALAVLSVIGSRVAQDPIRFPVTNVDILGTVDYEDRTALIAEVKQFTTKGFYSLDIDRVRLAVDTLPWVANARVSRVWPSRIEVHVEEHEPTARWNDDSLISKSLELFSPPQLQMDNPRYLQWYEVFSTLPQITGAPGRHGDLLDTFRDYEARLARFNVTLDALREDRRGSQALELSNQVIVRLGYEYKDLRFDRFLDVFDRFAGNPAESEGSELERAATTFDMRYSNGFALGGYGRSSANTLLGTQLTQSVQRPVQ